MPLRSPRFRFLIMIAWAIALVASWRVNAACPTTSDTELERTVDGSDRAVFANVLD